MILDSTSVDAWTAVHMVCSFQLYIISLYGHGTEHHPKQGSRKTAACFNCLYDTLVRLAHVPEVSYVLGAGGLTCL